MLSLQPFGKFIVELLRFLYLTCIFIAANSQLSQLSIMFLPRDQHELPRPSLGSGRLLMDREATLGSRGGQSWPPIAAVEGLTRRVFKKRIHDHVTWHHSRLSLIYIWLFTYLVNDNFLFTYFHMCLVLAAAGHSLALF